MLKTARERANLTQEAAADGLYLSRRTLSDYENGRTAPPPDVVDRMAEMYKNPLLRHMYCESACPLGGIHGKVENMDLPTLGWAVVNGINRLSSLSHVLAKVLADGKLEPHELPEYGQFEEVALDLRQKITAMQIQAASQLVVS